MQTICRQDRRKNIHRKNRCICNKTVKASHTHYRALGVELIPVYRQSVRSPHDINHPPGNRLPLLCARPAVTFPAAEHHRPLVKLYCLVIEAHRCEQLAQGSYTAFAQVGFEPTRPVDRKSNALPIAPPCHLYKWKT